MVMNTKTLNGNGTVIGAMDAVFAYAKEVLGSSWTYTPSVEEKNCILTFRDSRGAEHGWQFVSPTGDFKLISESISTDSGDAGGLSVQNSFTGVVWQAAGGSVGIGYQDDNGHYITWYLLAKFRKQYQSKDLYAVAVRGGGSTSSKIMIHGNVNISGCNRCGQRAIQIGSGVYLHPFYDPVTGIVSADIYGVRSMDTHAYGYDGHVVQQGGDSYMSILSGHDVSSTGGVNTLFVKM